MPRTLELPMILFLALWFSNAHPIVGGKNAVGIGGGACSVGSRVKKNRSITRTPKKSKPQPVLVPATLNQNHPKNPYTKSKPPVIFTAWTRELSLSEPIRSGGFFGTLETLLMEVGSFCWHQAILDFTMPFL